MQDRPAIKLYVPVLLGTKRIGRRSLDVARLRRRERVATELLDLAEYDFPLLEERLSDMPDPPAVLRSFQEKLVCANVADDAGLQHRPHARHRFLEGV